MGSRASFVGYLRHMIRHRTRETRRSTTTIFYGDAMCLIDAQKGRPKPWQESPKSWVCKPLGRQEEQLNVAGLKSQDRLFHHGGRQSRMQRRGANPGLFSPLDLVYHERYEGTYDDREPSQDERGHLITDALATTRRKDSQRVGARDRRLDKLLLPRAKGWVPEVLAKHILGMERPWHDSTVRASRGQEHGHRCRGGADVARR